MKIGKKNYKRRFCTLFFVSIFSVSGLIGQINKDGLPLIKKYTPEEYNAHSQNWAIVKDKRGYMYFGNNHGLLEYNGYSWNLFENSRSASIRSLATDDNGNIYYGSSQDFGMVLPHANGELSFHSFYRKYNSGNPDFNTIWNIQTSKEFIYFQSNEKIFKVNLPTHDSNNDDIGRIVKTYETETSFHWSFFINDNFYVREKGKGIQVEVNGKLEQIEGSDLFAEDRIYIMLPYLNDKILICSRNKGLFIYNPKATKEDAFVAMNSNANKLILESVVYDGVSLPDNKYAIATLQNGIIIIDRYGNIDQQINSNNGIDENMILSIFFDKEFGLLWFTGAVNGIYKVSLGSPFREWNKENGLDGVVVDAMRFNKKLYVATNAGVFLLNESEGEISRFKPIPEIPYEAWHFILFETEKGVKRLLVATTGGVFEIANKKIRRILDNQITLQLFQSRIDSKFVYVGLVDGIGRIEFNEKKDKWGGIIRNDSINNTIRSIYESINGKLYLGTQSAGVVKLNTLLDDSPLVIDTAQGLPLYGSEYRLFELNGEMLITAPKGLFSYDEENNVIDTLKEFGINYTENDLGVYGFIETNSDYWLSLYSNNRSKSRWQGVGRILKNGQPNEIDLDFSKEIPQKVAYSLYDDSSSIWVGNEKGLYKYDKIIQKDYNQPYNINILKVTTTEDSLLFGGTFYQIKDSVYYISSKQIDELKPELDYKHNQITFEYSAQFYEQEENTEYSYRLLGQNEKWTKWSKETRFPFINLSPGNYRFEVKAKNIYGRVSNITSYEFSILPPWYRTIWAYVLFVLLAIAFIWLIVRLNIRRLRKEKIRLEKIVEERTSEIRMKNVELEQQKEEISTQRDEIEAQRDHVTEQKEQIEAQHNMILEQTKSITDSIHYASKIQEALLPPDEVLNEVLPEHFILYKPRDIVSGDFYWATQKNNRTIIVAADCTGHGVPGAFMSMLGISFLNEIINKFQSLHASQILDELKASVKKSLRQTGKDHEAKDGMDMALCIMDFEKMQMEFSGAYNSLFVIRDEELIKYEADRMPVGIYVKDRGPFTNHIIDMKKGDNYYIFSDGYPDQFGGDYGTKLMIRRFKRLLLENHKYSAEKQKEILDKFLADWIAHKDEDGNNYRQLDDILVIGMKV